MVIILALNLLGIVLAIAMFVMSIVFVIGAVQAMMETRYNFNGAMILLLSLFLVTLSWGAIQVLSVLLISIHL